jgi:hypothetical protein
MVAIGRNQRQLSQPETDKLELLLHAAETF